MSINQFAVYQVKDGADYREIRFCPYEKLLEKKIQISSEFYNQVYISLMMPHEGVEQIHERMTKMLPKNFPGHTISTSDVYVLNRAGVISSYYVNKEHLIPINGFIRLEAGDAQISMDTTGYRIDGKGGTWVACEELTVEGRQFFLMQSEKYGYSAESLILAEDGTVVIDGCRGFDEAAIAQIQKFLHPPPKSEKPLTEQKVVAAEPVTEQKSLEKVGSEKPAEKVSSEKLASANSMSEIGSETATETAIANPERVLSNQPLQEMDEIERQINSLPKPRKIRGRVSVLDRLRIIQAKRAIREGKKPPRLYTGDKEHRKKK